MAHELATATYFTNAEEEKDKDIEEEMMQLNYERRVAVLLHQSDRVISAQLKRKVSRVEEDEESSRGLDKKLKSSNSSHNNNSSSSSSSSSSGGDGITTAEMMSMMEAASKEGEAIFDSLLGPTPTPADSVTSSTQNIVAPSGVHGPSGGDAVGTGGTSAQSRATDAHLDVAQIFKKKKADSKKLLAQALASEYNPLDFMDWTARSL